VVNHCSIRFWKLLRNIYIYILIHWFDHMWDVVRSSQELETFISHKSSTPLGPLCCPYGISESRNLFMDDSKVSFTFTWRFGIHTAGMAMRILSDLWTASAKKARWTWKLEQDGIMDYTKIASNYDTPSGLSLQNDHGSGLFSGVSSCFPLYSRLGYSVWTPHFWSQRWAKSHKISHKTCP